MTTIKVSPAVLVWARESSGLSKDSAITKLGLNPAYGKTAIERLDALEDGTDMPTRSFLLKMAKNYRRPLIAFYMESPPATGNRGNDFRLLPPEYTQVEDGLVDALIRDIKARQGLVRSAIECEDDYLELDFIDSMSRDDDVNSVSQNIAATIKFDLNIFRSEKNITNAFSYLRECIEDAGIFVILVSDLGSHHTKFSEELFRGFALSDSIAPFVAINKNDARSAWSFTLLHELAHLWLGQTGVSNNTSEAAIEQFCNNVASAILLPSTELHEMRITKDMCINQIIELISNFSGPRKVSRRMVTYNLFKMNHIDRDQWDQINKEFHKQYLEFKRQEHAKYKESSGGPNYYSLTKQKAGNGLIKLVSRLIQSGSMSSTKAGKVLGIRPKKIYPLIQQN